MTHNNTNNILENEINNMICCMLKSKKPIFSNIMIIKDVIKKDNIEYNLRDNILLTILSWRIYKDANNNLDEAIKIYKQNKAEYISIYQKK